MQFDAVILCILTDMTVITARAPKVPANTKPLFFFKASNTAMKNVLSPNSENSIRRNPEISPSRNASLPNEPADRRLLWSGMQGEQ